MAGLVPAHRRFAWARRVPSCRIAATCPAMTRFAHLQPCRCKTASIRSASCSRRRARGLFMGNRGGRFHTDERTLTRRRWASRHWICCVLDFNGRHRDVWGRCYTELFFLDEVTALAAGHRPCFECRRRDALAFAECWRQRASGCARARAPPRWTRCCTPSGSTAAPSAGTVAASTICRTAPSSRWRSGAFAVRGGIAAALDAGGLRRAAAPARAAARVDVLTPPAILAVLAAGYRPRWHPSAER